MWIRWWAIAFVACLAPLTAPGQEKIDNPLKNAKVGDFAEYKVTLTVKEEGRTIEAIMKKMVIARSDSEVTIKITSREMGREPRTPEEQKIDLTKPYNPLGVMGRAHKFTKNGEGKEKLKVGEKTYDCNWITGEQDWPGGPSGDPEVKVWYSKSVPVMGIVKVDFKGIFMMELTDSGNAK